MFFSENIFALVSQQMKDDKRILLPFNRFLLKKLGWQSVSLGYGRSLKKFSFSDADTLLSELYKWDILNKHPHMTQVQKTFIITKTKIFSQVLLTFRYQFHPWNEQLLAILAVFLSNLCQNSDMKDGLVNWFSYLTELSSLTFIFARVIFIFTAKCK